MLAVRFFKLRIMQNLLSGKALNVFSKWIYKKHRIYLEDLLKMDLEDNQFFKTMIIEWLDELDCIFIEITVQTEDEENVTYDYQLLDDTISHLEKGNGYDTRNDALEVAILKSVIHFNAVAP